MRTQVMVISNYEKISFLILILSAFTLTSCHHWGYHCPPGQAKKVIVKLIVVTQPNKFRLTAPTDITR